MASAKKRADKRGGVDRKLKLYRNLERELSQPPSSEEDHNRKPRRGGPKGGQAR